MDEATEKSKERILSEMARLADRDGKPPGVGRFERETGIIRYDILRFWPSWSDACNEAGLARNSWNERLPDLELFKPLAELTRRLSRFPTNNEIAHEVFKKNGMPNLSTYERRFGSKSKLVEAFHEWALNDAEYADVVTLAANALTSSRHKRSTTVAVTHNRVQSLPESYLPPVISMLTGLASGSPNMVSACKEQGKDENSEFERRVAIAFEIIGLSVERFGQGYGRVADCFAKCMSGGWAVLYDAKIRRDGYRLLTEDRKFREYIERHIPPLRSLGLHRVYFAIISSSFNESDIERAHHLALLTEAKSL